MVEYVKASPCDKEEVIDFINYVFSYSHCPHNFKAIMPKSYADDAVDMGAIHYMTKKDGKIRAVVANRVIDVSVNGRTLKFGLIGNVSVHPYSRGEGYMKELMRMSLDDAREIGIDIMCLGGQRQRYGYFGYENAGINLCFTVSKENIRHCFREVDASPISFRELKEGSEEEITKIRAMYEKRPFHALRSREEYFNIMSTWGGKCRLIYKDGTLIGYVWGGCGETVLEDEADFPLVLKALFEKDNLKEVTISAAPFEKERAAFLASICENSRVAMCDMVNVLNWERALDALLGFKAQYTPLADGEVCLDIAGEKLNIIVSGGVPSVKAAPDKDADITLSHNAAEQLFFGMNSLIMPDAKLKNWIPLPFMIDGPDTY